MIDDKSATEQMPQTIGRYQVKECIGYGAMGAVYKAFDPLIKRTLAIKTIRLDIPRQSPQYKNFIERFYHEARVSGTLSHPNIVTLFDIGEEGGLPYLAMEFVEGQTLATSLEKGPRFKAELVIALVSQVASALDYAHRMGVIHRDIKPSNLILFDQERVKVTDFGIAKLVDAEMTQSGQLLGTPSYMSPEQAMGEKLDGRSDIFSLGVCAFEMLSGEQPFPGNNVTAILYKLAHVDPVEPANLEMSGLLPQKWHDVFGKVLAKQPDERYQTAADFVRDLEFCLGSWFGSEQVENATVGLRPSSPPDANRTIMALPSVEDVTVEAKGKAQIESETLPIPAQKTASPAAPAPVPPVRQTPAPPKGDDSGKTVAMSPPGTPATARLPSGVPPPPRRSAAETPATVLFKPEAPSGATVVMPTTPKVPQAAAKPAVVAPPVSKPAAPEPAPAPAMPPPAVATPAGPATPPRTGGLPVGLIIGAIVLMALGALGVGGLLWLKDHLDAKPTPAPSASSTPPSATPTPVTPSTPAPPVVGTLVVSSEPPGANVTLDGELKGPAPLTLTDLALGEHELKLELKGYQPVVQTIGLTDAAPVAFNAPMTRSAPVSATLEVLSTPFGAIVRVDGAMAGPTPLQGYKLKPGTHKLELTRAGYETWTETVKLASGQSQRLDVTLKPLPPPPSAPPKDTFDPDKTYPETEVDTKPRKKSGKSIDYPDNAPKLGRGASVSVRLQFVVTENGDVTDVQVIESAGQLVDEAALARVRTWKYTPGQKRGTNVKVLMTFRQTWS